MKLRSWLFIPLALIDCAVAQDASKDRYALALQPRVYLTHQTANNSFRIDSTGYRMGAAFVNPLAVMIVQSNESAKWQQKLDLRDPVNYLKERIAETLTRELGLTNLQVLSEASDLPVLARDDGNSEKADRADAVGNSTFRSGDEAAAPSSPGFRAYEDERPAPAITASVPNSPAGTPASPAMRGYEAAPRAAQDPTFRDTHPAGAVLQVVTRKWGIDNYKMSYRASYWLFDLEKKKRLRSGTCQILFDQVDDKSMPTSAPNRNDPNEVPAYAAAMEDAIFGNDGALLKANLRKAAEQCADRITAQLFAGRRGAVKTK